jgi:hypothetical protein
MTEDSPLSGRDLLAKPTLDSAIQRVTVVDVSMPFGSMIMLMVKLAIAAIPAGIIIGLLFLFLTAILTGVMGR